MNRLNENEIIVIANQNPGTASFDNYEELKKRLSEGLSVYSTTDYSVENIDVARSDFKELKSIKKQLSDKKKELEKAYSMPIEEVSEKLGELIDLVNVPYKMLDNMIKDFEKTEKKKEIIEYATEKASVLGEYGTNVVNSEMFFNEKWLNKSLKEKEWKSEVDKKIMDAADAIAVINETGGENKPMLLAFYFSKLSLDGADQFLNVAKSESKIQETEIVDDDKVIGYKVLKISGTRRQMNKLLSVLEMSDFDYEEIEDGMPVEMKQRLDTDFDTFIAFDLEHTGTFGISRNDAESEITELGAVKVVNGKIVDRFSMLANPGRKITPMMERYTHITNDMVKDEPSIDEVIKKFKEFVGDFLLLGHNIKACDIPHITKAGKRVGIHFDNEFYDTRILANKLKEKNGWKETKLPYLSEYYKVSQENAHRAMCDAEANAEVFMKMKEEIKS